MSKVGFITGAGSGIGVGSGWLYFDKSHYRERSSGSIYCAKFVPSTSRKIA